MTRFAVLLIAAAATFSPNLARANSPPPRPCESRPWARQGIAPPIARKLARVMRQLAAAVPHPRADRCRVTLDEIPRMEIRSDCWDAPETFYVQVDCEKPSEGKDSLRPAILVTLSMRPADYRTEWEIVESTPDLLVTTTGGNGPTATTLIFGARREPWSSESGTMRRETGWTGSNRPENAYQGPFIVSVEVAVRSGAADTTRDLVRQIDRAAIMKLLKSEVEARRAARVRARQRE